MILMEIKNDVMMRQSSTRKIRLDVVLLEKAYQKKRIIPINSSGK